MSVVVKLVSGEISKHFLNFARRNILLNSFMIYYRLKLRKYCDFYVAFDEEEVVAVSAVYHGKPEFDQIFLRGSAEGMEEILRYIEPVKATIVCILREELDAVRSALDGRIRSIYEELFMICKPEWMRDLVRHPVRRLTLNDVKLLLRLYSKRYGWKTDVKSRRRMHHLLSMNKYFAVVTNKEIASIAVIDMQLPEASCVDSVYTAPEWRNRGLATSVTSAATKEALNDSEIAFLGVRSNNYSAIRIYFKIGYRTLTKIYWVNVGVDVKL